MTNNFSCIIVDDEPDAIELLTDRLGRLFKNVIITGTFTYWQDALEVLRTQKVDILMLDISMPGKNAMELLRLLPNLECEIIFVTAHENYALDAFSFSASGYILKPIDDTELATAVSIATGRVQNKKLAKQIHGQSLPVNDKIGIPNNHGIDYINIRDILYLESVNKCTKIVTAHAVFTSSLYLGKFQSLVDHHSFFQVHRSYIVNLNSILRYESSGDIIMSDKKQIPVSRNIKNDFLKIFNSNY